MRKSLPASGDIRIKSGFLWFPRTISSSGRKERRWFERATWEQKYTGLYWIDQRWVEKPLALPEIFERASKIL